MTPGQTPAAAEGGEHGAEKGEGTAEECGHLKLGAEVEDKGAETCEEEGGTHAQSGDDRNQHCGAEHGEHVLETQGKGLSDPQRSDIINCVFLFHIIIVK